MEDAERGLHTAEDESAYVKGNKYASHNTVETHWVDV